MSNYARYKTYKKMKSRITIEVDFDNGNQPVLQVIQRDSDDVRDNLLKAFLQSLQGSSSWLKIRWATDYHDHQQPENNFARIHISTIKPHELLAESKVMAEQSGLDKKFNKKQ